METSESEAISGVNFYPTIWELLRSAVNGFFSVILLFILAAYGAPVTPFIVFLWVFLIGWNMVWAWCWHYRVLSLGDCLAISCLTGGFKKYQWTELDKAIIYHHRGWITPSYIRLEFVSRDGELVEYYLSDLPMSERKMALAVLRAKLPGLPDIF
jgi:hypothetical protein